MMPRSAVDLNETPHCTLPLLDLSVRRLWKAWPRVGLAARVGAARPGRRPTAAATPDRVAR